MRLWLAGLIACSTNTPAWPPPSPTPTPTPLAHADPDPALASRLAQLDGYLAGQLVRRHVPGMVAAVVTRDGLAWSKAYGIRNVVTRDPVTTETLFRIGSITKVVTALAVLQLRDAGKLDLDAPVSTWIADLAAVTAPTTDSPPITLRHLMTHMSGLPREPQLDDPYGRQHEVTEPELLASLHHTRLDTSPGTTWAYSNLGAALEGLVIARASGQPYAAYTTEHLLRPLGMMTATFDRAAIPDATRATSYTRNKNGEAVLPAIQLREGATAARGQLYASVQDMARLAIFELQAWPPRDDADPGPVRRSTVRESQRTEGPFAPGPHTKGAAWFLDTTPKGNIVSHGGAGEGFMSELWISTDANLAFVLMINDDDAAIVGIAEHAQNLLLPGNDTPLDLVAKLLDDPTEDHAQQLVEPATLQAMLRDGSLARYAAFRAAGSCVVTKTEHADDSEAYGQITCGIKALLIGVHVTAHGWSTQITSLHVDERPTL